MPTFYFFFFLATDMACVKIEKKSDAHLKHALNGNAHPGHNQ